jgi:hypothetical protein
MTIEQTVEIPANHRLVLEVPPEIPVGKAKAAITLVFETETPQPEEEKDMRKATPHTDWLCGLLSHVGDISLEELREERLSKYLK